MRSNVSPYSARINKMLIAPIVGVALATLKLMACLCPSKFPHRLLVISFLLSTPKLYFVFTSQPKQFTPSPKVSHSLRFVWVGIPQWHYGDEWLLFSNLHSVRKLNDIVGWFCGDWVGKNGFYRPITSISLLIDYKLWGDRRSGYILTAWLLHVLTTLLFALLIEAVTGDGSVAVAGMVSFALVWYAPSVVTLTFMSTRPDVLCVPLVMATLMLGLKWSYCGHPKWLMLACVMTVISLWAKEIACVLPLLMLTCVLAGWHNEHKPDLSRSAIAIFFMAVVVFFWLLAYHSSLPEAMHKHGMLAMKPERFATQLYILSIRLLPYVSELPTWLIAIPYSLLTMRTVYLFLQMCLFAVLLMLSWRHARSALPFPFLWIVVASLPLIPVRLWSPHYFYLSSFGVHVLNGAFFVSLLRWLCRFCGSDSSPRCGGEKACQRL
ncbi:MAG: hypothetical protein RUDDFDWM_001789 [Candidatus Fervidibacterota bacterium]